MKVPLNVEVGPDAERDLAAIADYLIDTAGKDVAFQFVDDMLARIATLAEFPLRGPIPRELEALGETDFRQLLVGRYRIFYEVGDAQITIALIADGRRDMGSLLRDRLLNREDPA